MISVLVMVVVVFYAANAAMAGHLFATYLSEARPQMGRGSIAVYSWAVGLTWPLVLLGLLIALTLKRK